MHKLDGIWDLTIKTFVGDQKSTLEIKVDGNVLTGKSTDKNSGNSCEITNGIVDGDNFSYKAAVKLPMGHIKFAIEGSIQEDGTLTGTSKTVMGKFPITATKIN